MDTPIELRLLLSKNVLDIYELSHITTDALPYWIQAIETLMFGLEIEKIMSTNSNSRYVLNVDILIVKKNMSTFLGVKTLRSLKLGTIYLN
jgi:hypothetical protein